MSRGAFDAFIQGQPGRPVLLPLTERLASRVGSDSYEDMTADPALWGGHLARTARLLESDGVVLGFEQAGRSGVTIDDPLLRTAMEAVDRLRQTEGAWLGCIGAMTGPVATSAALGEENGRQVAIDIAEAYCKKRPDLLVLREGAVLGQGEIGMPQRKLYNTIRNMAAYYSVPLAVHLEQYDPARLADLGKLKVSHVFLGPDRDGQVPSPAAVAALIGAVEAIAVPLPESDADNFIAQARDYRAACGDLALAFTSLGTIEKDIDLAVLRTLWGQLRTVG